jgi:hypothetical protein
MDFKAADSGHLRCDAASLAEWLPTFQRDQLNSYLSVKRISVTSQNTRIFK